MKALIAKIFKWGKASKAHLAKTHPDLGKVFTDALTKYSVFDVSLICSVRTKAEQQQRVDEGASKTLNSQHIPFKVKVDRVRTKITNALRKKLEDGLAMSHALDIIMIDENGKGTFKAEYYYAFVEAVRIAAVKNNVPVIWGGCWKDVRTIICVRTAVDNYIRDCKAKGKDPFLDLGHFHLQPSAYKR